MKNLNALLCVFAAATLLLGCKNKDLSAAVDENNKTLDYKFWKYTNRLYEITPSVTQDSPQGLSRTQLPIIAQFAGLNINEFNNCLATSKF